jgi:diadenosine tetraphosphate (Ap4A) HIT family hydrolase
MAGLNSLLFGVPLYYPYMASAEQFPYCEICPIIENPQQQDIDFRIHEGEAWRVTLRDNQALLGTTFITLKGHKEGLEQLSYDDDEEFRTIRNRLIGAVGVAFAPDGVNLSCLMNYAFRSNGNPDFTPQPHVHYHFKPRYSTPRTVAGETFTDPEFADYLKIGRGQRVMPEVGKVIVARIRENF